MLFFMWIFQICFLSTASKHFGNCYLNSAPLTTFRSSRPEVFLRKSVLKICSKFTGEHPCRSVISIKLLCNFIEITLRHGCFPVNLLHISEHLLLRTPPNGCFCCLWYYSMLKWQFKSCLIALLRSSVVLVVL